MAPRTRRAIFSVTFFLSTCAVLGSFISKKVAAQSATDESTLRDSLHSFTDVYSLVEQNYAEKLTTDKTDKAIYDGAIPGMLHVLDPHSNFYDPKAFAQMREDQHGKYYGVGMQIQPQPDKAGIVHIVVLAPFEGTPAYKAGIRPGDVIMSVDGKIHRQHRLRRRRHPPQRTQGHPRLRHHGPRRERQAPHLRPRPR